MHREKTIGSYLAQIKAFYADHRRMPSYAELLTVFGFKSKNAVFKRVRVLIEKGFLEKDLRGRLLLKEPLLPVKVLGSIAAGFPSPAEEELVDTMSLDQYLIANPQATYLLKVDGDSMIDAGIRPGDLILVQKNLVPKSGDIVVAQVDGAWTLKFFEKKGKQVYLRSANKKYPDIIPTYELVIAGVVVANVRKYR